MLRITPRGRVHAVSVIASVAAVLLLTHLACGNDKGKAIPSMVNTLTWRFSKSGFGPTEVVVTVPKNASPKNRMPVLVALHGQGESRKRPAKGARGWPDDYQMLRAFGRLAALPLTRRDFGSMVDDNRLALFNRSLEKRPYRGVIVVCPYLPDRFRAKRLKQEAAVYSDFLVKKVLTRVYKETPAVGTAASTGIDGVSLGGRVSVTVGLSRPDVFGAVGGIQAAFGKKQVDGIVEQVRQARKENPGLRFRLMSSEQDVFLDVTQTLSGALSRSGVRHQVDIVKGNHSYEFNQGPGVYEMLVYYDRILRGEAFW